jgi:hypothetical protein
MYGELVHQSSYGFHSFMHICTEHTAPSNHARRLHSLLALPNGNAHAHTTRLPRKRRHPINICRKLSKHHCVYPVPSVLCTRVPCLYTQHTFCFTHSTLSIRWRLSLHPTAVCLCKCNNQGRQTRIYTPLGFVSQLVPETHQSCGRSVV